MAESSLHAYCMQWLNHGRPPVCVTEMDTLGFDLKAVEFVDCKNYVHKMNLQLIHHYKVEKRCDFFLDLTMQITISLYAIMCVALASWICFHKIRTWKRNMNVLEYQKNLKNEQEKGVKYFMEQAAVQKRKLKLPNTYKAKDDEILWHIYLNSPLEQSKDETQTGSIRVGRAFLDSADNSLKEVEIDSNTALLRINFSKETGDKIEDDSNKLETALPISNANTQYEASAKVESVNGEAQYDFPNVSEKSQKSYVEYEEPRRPGTTKIPRYSPTLVRKETGNEIKPHEQLDIPSVATHAANEREELKQMSTECPSESQNESVIKPLTPLVRRHLSGRLYDGPKKRNTPPAKSPPPTRLRIPSSYNNSTEQKEWQ